MSKIVIPEDGLFLGLDSSTQSLKAILIDGSLRVVYEQSVQFDRDLPQFKTEGGVHRSADGLTVTAPPLMWVAALDRLLARMQADKCPLGRVLAVSGSGQQHGSVWLKRKAQNILRHLDGRKTLQDQLSDVFSVNASPVWMDSSTTAECRALELAMGGAQVVADVTGSRAYERFTGNQIAKIHRTLPHDYEMTDRIALVSSFMASLLIGDYAPIDTSDGSGMNLMDIRLKAWDANAIKITATWLDAKLGPVVPSHTDVGHIHRYYVDRWGFDPACRVIAFSGDNPCSLAGLRLQAPGDVAISLGTSDTMFGSLSDPKPSAEEGHVFVSPVDPAHYMAMVCFKNGSLTREHVRVLTGAASWAAYGQLLKETAPGNQGQLGFYIKEPEITPTILKTGIFRFDATGKPVPAFPAAAEARAVLEGQFLSMRMHGGNIGLSPASILATGGASVDAGVLRVMSDVFGVPVYVGDQPNSSSLGAAYRALHGWVCQAAAGKWVRFADALAHAPAFRKAVDPDMAAHAVYNGLLEKFRHLERVVVAMGHIHKG